LASAEGIGRAPNHSLLYLASSELKEAKYSNEPENKIIILMQRFIFVVLGRHRIYVRPLVESFIESQ